MGICCYRNTYDLNQRKITVSKKDKPDSKMVFFMTQIKERVKTELQTALSWLDTIDGRILLKGISSISPYIVGSPIGFLFPFIIESTDMMVRKRFLRGLTDIGNELDYERSNLNMDFIKTPEGQQLLKNTFRKIIQENSEEKIEYLRKFLITSYSDKKPDSELTNAFFKILENMEPIHIKLLTILKNPKEILLKIAEQRKQNPRSVSERKYGKSDYALYWEVTGQDDINEFYLQTNPIVYHNALKDLVKWNIIETVFMRHWIYFGSTFNDNFTTMVHEMQRWTTDFGEQFLDSIYRK